MTAKISIVGNTSKFSKICPQGKKLKKGGVKQLFKTVYCINEAHNKHHNRTSSYNMTTELNNEIRDCL